MKYIDSIPTNKKREGVILIGRGPSVDNLDLEALNSQQRYDICTITDAIKLVKNPTYTFNYHDQGLRRIWDYVKNPVYLIMPDEIIGKINTPAWMEKRQQVLRQENIYFFMSRNRHDLDIFINGDFDIQVTRKLWSRHGSVGGVINFLYGYMGYKKVFYTGFDGGTKYGEKVHSNRKETKILGAARDYQRSWETVSEMLKHYPDVTFEPLTQFLVKDNKKQDS